MTPTQLKEAIDKEVEEKVSYDKTFNGEAYEWEDEIHIETKEDLQRFAYRIAALTAEAMVGDKQQYGSGTWSYYERIAEERQLADEIKKLSE